MKNITLIIILFIFSSNVFSQSEIWKMNGKKIITDTLLVDTSNYVFYTNKKGKTKAIEKTEVFSVTQNKSMRIFYVPDTISDSFTIVEMHAYLSGMNDGYNHKSYFFVSGGAIVGLAAPLTFPLVGVSDAITPIPPALYTALIAIPKVKEDKIDVPQKYKNDEHYIFGYQTAAKKKRITNTIISSIAGLTIGTVATIFVYSY